MLSCGYSLKFFNVLLDQLMVIKLNSDKKNLINLKKCFSIFMKLFILIQEES